MGETIRLKLLALIVCRLAARALAATAHAYTQSPKEGEFPEHLAAEGHLAAATQRYERQVENSIGSRKTVDLLKNALVERIALVAANGDTSILFPHKEEIWPPTFGDGHLPADDKHRENESGPISEGGGFADLMRANRVAIVSAKGDITMGSGEGLTAAAGNPSPTSSSIARSHAAENLSEQQTPTLDWPTSTRTDSLAPSGTSSTWEGLTGQAPRGDAASSENVLAHTQVVAKAQSSQPVAAPAWRRDIGSAKTSALKPLTAGQELEAGLLKVHASAAQAPITTAAPLPVTTAPLVAPAEPPQDYSLSGILFIACLNLICVVLISCGVVGFVGARDHRTRRESVAGARESQRSFAFRRSDTGNHSIRSQRKASKLSSRHHGHPEESPPEIAVAREVLNEGNVEFSATIEQQSEAFWSGTLLKKNDDADLFDPKYWNERQVWIGQKGVLYYWSKKDQRVAICFDGTVVQKLIIKQLATDEAYHPYCMSIERQPSENPEEDPNPTFFAAKEEETLTSFLQSVSHFCRLSQLPGRKKI